MYHTFPIAVYRISRFCPSTWIIGYVLEVIFHDALAIDELLGCLDCALDVIQGWAFEPSRKDSPDGKATKWMVSFSPHLLLNLSFEKIESKQWISHQAIRFPIKRNFTRHLQRELVHLYDMGMTNDRYFIGISIASEFKLIFCSTLLL